MLHNRPRFVWLDGCCRFTLLVSVKSIGLYHFENTRSSRNCFQIWIDNAIFTLSIYIYSLICFTWILSDKNIISMWLELIKQAKVDHVMPHLGPLCDFCLLGLIRNKNIYFTISNKVQPNYILNELSPTSLIKTSKLDISQKLHAWHRFIQQPLQCKWQLTSMTVLDVHKLNQFWAVISG